jgi:cytochrome c
MRAPIRLPPDGITLNDQGPDVRTLLLIAIALPFGGIAPGARAGDAAAGETAFKVCRTCHQIGPGAKNFIGPVLNGVVGRPAGSYAGYDYSAANKTSGITWDVATLKVYLHNPRARVPGTKMTFAGFESDAKIDDVIAYLSSFAPDGTRK